MTFARKPAFRIAAAAGLFALALAVPFAHAQDKGAMDLDAVQMSEALRQAQPLPAAHNQEVIRAFAEPLDREIAAAFDKQPEVRDTFLKQLNAIAAIKDFEERLRAAKAFQRRNRDLYAQVLGDAGIDLSAHAARLQDAFAAAGAGNVRVTLTPDFAFEITEEPEKADDPWQGMRIPINEEKPPPPPPPVPVTTRTLAPNEYVDNRREACFVIASGAASLSATGVASAASAMVGGECTIHGSKLATVRTLARAPAVSTGADGRVRGFAAGFGGLSMCTVGARLTIFNQDFSSGSRSTLFDSAIAPFYWVATIDRPLRLSGGAGGDTVRVFYSTDAYALATPGIGVITATATNCTASFANITTSVTQ